MSDYFIDYEKVLMDLEGKRDALNAAIDGIKKLLAVASQVLPDGTFRPLIGQGAESNEVASDSFFSMSIPDAIEKYLKMTKKPQTYFTIAEALEKGGLTHTSKSFSNTVNTTLNRMAKGQDAKVVKQNGGKWGLAEWYPGAAKRAALTARKDLERQGSESSEDSPLEGTQAEEVPGVAARVVTPDRPSLPIESEPPSEQSRFAA